MSKPRKITRPPPARITLMGSSLWPKTSMNIMKDANAAKEISINAMLLFIVIFSTVLLDDI